MALRDVIFGRALRSSEESNERLSIFTGVPVLGLDALASTGYGPEAALVILTPLGLAGLRLYPFIVLAVLFQLLALYVSYRQTAAAYPGGGGAYVVSRNNLGGGTGVWAAVALLLDYLLNVAVAIASGIGAVVSAIPALHSHALLLCLIVLVSLTVMNLRGVRESGLVFVLPVFVFVACIAITIGWGLVHVWLSGGQPRPAVSPPPLPSTNGHIGAWVVLTAFANGSTALTGIEAVSNGVPLFRKPTVRNAQRTLTVIALILGLFLLGIAYLSPAYRLVGMTEQAPGYQTVLSQLVAAVAGRGVFYYFTLTTIFIVLTYSAQTSFADFPRVCRLLAEDRFLPPAFANRGRRLVYSHGIVVLAILAALLLVAFGGNIDRIIPLFAVGAFLAFFFSQLGMVTHWLHKRGRGFRTKLAYNALGAATTGVALAVIVIAKFTEGAWMTAVVVPLVVLLLHRIERHYRRVARQIEEPFSFHLPSARQPVVVVPLDGWNKVAEKALRFGVMISDEVIAVHVHTERDAQPDLRRLWAEKVEAPARARGASTPRLAILDSPYRLIHQPLIDFIDRTAREYPDRVIAVVLPELASSRWWQNVLHDLRGAAFRMLLYARCDQRTLVIQVPWYLT